MYFKCLIINTKGMTDKDILAIVFGSSILAIPLFLAILASATKILYKTKSPVNMTHLEHKVLQGRATIRDRISLFANSLFISFVTPHVFIVAGVITLIAWVVLLLL